MLVQGVAYHYNSQTTIIQPLKEGEEPHSLEMLRAPSALGKPRGEWPPPPSAGLWRCFRFTKAKVVALKAQAEELCSMESDVSFFSSVKSQNKRNVLDIQSNIAIYPSCRKSV